MELLAALVEGYKAFVALCLFNTSDLLGTCFGLTEHVSAKVVKCEGSFPTGCALGSVILFSAIFR